MYFIHSFYQIVYYFHSWNTPQERNSTITINFIQQSKYDREMKEDALKQRFGDSQ